MASAPADGVAPVDLDAATVAADALPEALAALHARLPVGGRAALGRAAPDEPDPIPFGDLVEGAGFATTGGVGAAVVVLQRQRTLPDRVGPGLRLLVCGLNPSVYSADAGIGFARPGNRFWPAALAAGLVTEDRDPTDALVRHGVGMTDLVKRATPRADALTVDEYRAGLARVTRLVTWLRPAVVCFVGLSGWRAAGDRHAVAGWQDDPLGATPVYVMPSTSGLNAHASLDALTGHLLTAVAGP